jgi:c-di-GMP-binding flagellar brake protein YcgR
MAASFRRRHRRIDALGCVFAQLGGGWEASVLNLSVGGMLLRLKRSLTPGSSYVVKLFLEEQIAIVDARVVRLYKMSQAVSEEQDEAECFAALQFTSVPTRDAACLRGYIND